MSDPTATPPPPSFGRPNPTQSAIIVLTAVISNMALMLARDDTLKAGEFSMVLKGLEEALASTTDDATRISIIKSVEQALKMGASIRDGVHGS